MIREYKESDRAGVVDMWHSLDSSTSSILIDCEMDDNVIYVMEEKDSIVAFIAYTDFTRYRKIAALYVKPDYRRDGIATELMDYVDTGGYMRLLSNFDYKGAHRFYKSIGYKQNKPIKGNDYFVFTFREHTDRNSVIVACFIGVVAVVFIFIEHIFNRKPKG
jgi:GNAT superfamily N-acetyltransferase